MDPGALRTRGVVRVQHEPICKKVSHKGKQRAVTKRAPNRTTPQREAWQEVPATLAQHPRTTAVQLVETTDMLAQDETLQWLCPRLATVAFPIFGGEGLNSCSLYETGLARE